MRPIDKSTYTENLEEYNPYGDAKEDLLKALGPYCSFCERQGYSSALDIEHVENKDNVPEKKFLWSNFILGCKNCNPIKGTKPIVFSEIILPHLDNVFVCFRYLESGMIAFADNLDEPSKAKTRALIDLVGLDRRPGHPNYSTKDKRWEERKKTWEIAKRYHIKYNAQKADIETIIDLAKANGFFSIWMHTFADYPEVQTELINTFPGTRKECFEIMSV